MKNLLASLAIVAIALGICSSARAQNEINLLAPGPIREPLDKLLAAYQSKVDLLNEIAEARASQK